MNESASVNQNWHAYGGADCAGTWHWSLQVDVKWRALVSDHSQVSAPVQQTKYHPAAHCGSQLFGHKQFFDTLEEAKRVAVEFTQDLASRCPCVCEGHWVPDTGQYTHHYRCPMTIDRVFFLTRYGIDTLH